MTPLSWARICRHSASANGIGATSALHCTSSSRKWLHVELSVQGKLSVALPGTAHHKSLAGAGAVVHYPTPEPPSDSRDSPEQAPPASCPVPVALRTALGHRVGAMANEARRHVFTVTDPG